jgi:hypothetical protein
MNVFNVPDQPMDDAEQIRAPWMKHGEYILIQSEMYAEDDIAIKNKLMSSEADKDSKNKKTIFNYNLGDAQLLTLQRMIRGWNIIRTRKDGSTYQLPYSVENVRKLPKPYYDFAYKEINDRNPDLDEQEQQDFLPPSLNVIEAVPLQSKKH